MAKQELTITLAGKHEMLSPASFITAMDSLVALLRSIDSSFWRVEAPRYKWHISSASMKSPMNVSMVATLASPEAPNADVVGALFAGLKALDAQPKIPSYFDEDALLAARRLVSVYRDSIASISLASPGRADVRPTTRVARNVDELVAEERAKFYHGYGSIEGRLRQITVDPRVGHERSSIQIVDRVSGNVVPCRLSPDMAQELAKLMRNRVVLYGTIRYDESHQPTRIQVESYDPIPEVLPSLEDLHRIGVNITGGEDAADYVDHLRGNAD